MMKKLFHSQRLQCILLTILLLGGMLLELHPLITLERCVYDTLARFRRSAAERPVVVVAIDDRSIQQIGGWPWPRSTIADMIRRLSDYRADTLGIGLLYQQEVVEFGMQEIQAIKNLPWANLLKSKKPKYLTKTQKKNLAVIDKALKSAEKQLAQNRQMEQAVFNARNAVLPVRFVFDEVKGGVSPQVTGKLAMNSIDVTADRKQPQASSAGLRGLRQKPISAANVLQPYANLSMQAGALGHINMLGDDDQIIRSIPQIIQYKAHDFPSFALQITRKYFDVSLKRLQSDRNGLSLRHMVIPTDSAFRMLIDYGAAQDSIQKYSYIDVLNEKVPDSAFRNKIVIIGITAEGVAPRYKTTLHTKLSDIEISAHAIENMVNQRFISRPGWAMALEVMALVYFMFFLVLIIPKVNLRAGMLILGVFLFTWLAIAAVLFIGYGYWIQVIAPVVLSLVGFAIMRHQRVSSERRHERVELNKSLGLSLQTQGMLDTALEKFRQCPVEDPSVRELLYNLALDFERKRMHNKALAVYRRILKAGKFKDIQERIKNLKQIESSVVLPGGKNSKKNGLLLGNATTRPLLGRYEISKELGQGAMGTVYLGMDPSINREVAIKTLSYADIEPGELGEVKSQFFREAEAAGKLSHPNIVTIYDVGEDHDMAYIAMELLIGKDLAHYCKKETLLPIKRVLRIIAAVAEALDYAHNQGVVHRDIKPANILLMSNDQVKVADFGIARVMSASSTQTGIIFGTPNYMSPEQVAGKKVDGRSDLFSLGVVCYELLSAQKPFQGDNLTTLMYAISNAEYTPISEVAPKVPPCCVEIVEKLLAKGVSKRFKTAGQAARQLNECTDLI
jgi:serine/threonine-protein kinase